MNRLTAKQEKFCREYIVDHNATKAAIRANYSEKTAGSIGQRLSKNVDIKKRIKELEAEQEARTEINADWVIRQWVNLIEICTAAKPVMIKVGKEFVKSGTYEIDSAGANKALENLAKHLGMFQPEVPPVNNFIQNFLSGNGYKDKTDEEIKADITRKVNTAFDGCGPGNRL